MNTRKQNRIARRWAKRILRAQTVESFCDMTRRMASYGHDMVRIVERGAARDVNGQLENASRGWLIATRFALAQL